MAKKKSPPKHRNAAARALASPLYRKRVVKHKKRQQAKMACRRPTPCPALALDKGLGITLPYYARTAHDLTPETIGWRCQSKLS